MILKFILPLLVLGSFSVQAKEDGKLLYSQMCASCHGVNGEGVGNGSFPPLSDSEWLKGDPNRVAQIMLHGISGPIKVREKEYNLMMPPQGSLSDEQAVAVIRYIKEVFARDPSDYSLKEFQAAKKISANRTEPWTPEELLKRYPIPVEKSPISNLIMRVHHGRWDEMPDFSKLEGVAEEEEHDGYFSLRNITRKHNFGLVWTGDLKVSETAEYEFELDTNDGSALYIGDKLVTQVEGTADNMKTKKAIGKIKLTKGSHTIKFHYFQKDDDANIFVRWGKASTKRRTLLSREAPERKKPTVIDLTPKDGKTRIFHHFIDGSTHRTMGVGFPNGYNIAFSLTDCQPDLIWFGKFISAGRHWVGRGHGAQKPFSDKVLSMGKGVAWTNKGKQLEIELRGYTFDKQGNPTFKYNSPNYTFSEAYLPSDKKLTRTITIESKHATELDIRLSTLPATASNNGADIAGLHILMPDFASYKANDSGLNGTVKLNKGKNTFTIEYSWKK